MLVLQRLAKSSGADHDSESEDGELADERHGTEDQDQICEEDERQK